MTNLVESSDMFFREMSKPGEWKVYDKQTKAWNEFALEPTRLDSHDGGLQYATMVENVLYITRKETYPFVDVLLKTESGDVIGIQVTFSDNHAKPVSAYEKLRKLLAMPDDKTLQMYFVANLKHIEKYIERINNGRSFFTPENASSNLPITFNVLSNDRLTRSEYSFFPSINRN